MNTVGGLSAAKYELLQRRLRAPSQGVAAEPRSIGPCLEPAPLSSAQRRLWFLDQLEPGSRAYNIVEGIRLESPDAYPYDIDILRRCLNEVVARHSVLRTTFELRDGEPVQKVAPTMEPPFDVVDLRSQPRDVREAEAVRIASEEGDTPFDLSRGPLLRVRVVRMRDNELVVVLAVHHIVFDGWSFGVLVRETADLYEAFATGAPSPLPPLALQYGDYSRWQKGRLEGPRFEEQLRYWRAQLGDNPQVLELPLDHPRRPLQVRQGANYSFRLPADLSAALVVFARRNNVTMFMLLLAAYQVLLARYSGQDRFAVGTPIAGRTHQDLESLIGFFVNTLVISGDLSGDPTFAEHLLRVREASLGAYAHQEMPFEKLVEELKPQRQLHQSPLFQVMFSVLTVAGGAAAVDDGYRRGNPVHAERRTAHFDLSLGLEDKNGWCGSFEYDAELFDRETIERMACHFETLLCAAVKRPELRISELPLEEMATAPRLGARDGEVWRSVASVPEQFLAQVRRSPEAVAVVEAGRAVSYRELDARAEQLGLALREQGVGPEVIVGVCMERSIDLVVTLLGVWKAGGAYLPLDPSYPDERLEFMLEDAGVKVVVSDENLVGRMWPGRVVLTPKHRAMAPVGELGEVKPEQLAYVIYTSGSSGAPKGVEVEHGAIGRYIATVQEEFALKATDRILQFTAPTFDVAGEEIWGALTSGATLVLRTAELHTSMDTFLTACEEWKLTVLDLPTAFFGYVVGHLSSQGLGLPKSVRLVVVGGEALPVETLRAWQEVAERPMLINAYGPTEATVSATFWRLGGSESVPLDRVPIGEPLPGVFAYVLDGHGRAVPRGLAGELCVGGVGLARGYLRRPELTRERFIENPFGAGRLYRTGDQVRVLSDGNLVFLGRTDQQVKVRGYRIELGDIEHALSSHAAVSDAAVLCAGGERDATLVGYVVPRAGATVDPSELRRYLKGRLPEPMVPSRVVVLERWPLTSHGKVDRRALALLPLQADESAEVVAPRDEVELRLARLWEEILGRASVGPLDNFFELGGHSFDAIALVQAIAAEFDVKLSVSALFEVQTLEELASRLRERQVPRPHPCLVPLQVRGRNRPLFVMHPVGGNVLCYAELVRALGTDSPVYGLQARGLEGEVDSDLRTMAEAYAKAIRSVQSDGPYTLCGWSFGGAVAHAVASELESTGHSVEAVYLFDSWANWGGGAPPGAESPNETETRLVRWFLDDLVGGRSLNLPAAMDPAPSVSVQLERGIDAARDAQLLPLRTDPEWVSRLFEVFRANLAALRAYSPKRIRAPLTLFKASSNQAGVNDRDHGWTPFAESLAVRSVPGNHFTMLQRANIVALVAELTRVHNRVPPLTS